MDRGNSVYFADKFSTSFYEIFRGQVPRAGTGVVRVDPLCFLARCRTRRLNQVRSVLDLVGGVAGLGRRTFSILRQTGSWMDDHCVVKPSAIGQPTWPTQPSIP